MPQFVMIRLLQAIFVVWAVASAAFLLVHVVPGDPAKLILGVRATPSAVESMHQQLGLDQALPHAYLAYMSGLLHGDLGTSITFRPSSVSSVVGPRIMPSVLLLLYSLAITALVTVPLAVWAALRRNQVSDHVIRGLSTVAFVTPSFWLGLLLAYLFGLRLKVLPVSGYQSGFGAIQSLTLPAITVALSVAPIFVRALRSSTIETLSMDFVRAAHARGLSRRRVLVRHVLRNSLMSTVTLLGVWAGMLLSLTVVVENVFGIPGLGSLVVQAVSTRDYPVVQALALVFGLGVVVSNFLADVAYAAIDPRVRL